MGKWSKPHPLKKVWTEEDVQFLKTNWPTMTNQQLADGVGRTLTLVRYKLSELGFKKIEMEYWTPEQVKYLQENFKTKGDVELAEIFASRWPKKKRWTKNHIAKKRKYLKLVRTPAEKSKLVSANASPGGNSFTIDKNSCSVNLHPTWVAQRIAWRDPEAQQLVLKDKDLMATATNFYRLKRKINEKQNHRSQ